MISAYVYLFVLSFKASVIGAIFIGMGLSWFTFALITVVVHEASHSMFLIGSLSFLNNTFGWIVSLFFGIDFKTEWLEGHTIHHNVPLTEGDPQVCRAFSGREMGKEILKFIFIPFFVIYKASYAQSTAGIFNCTGRGKSLLVTSTSILMMAGIIYLSVRFQTYSPIIALYVSYILSAIMNLVKVALEHGGDLKDNPHPLLRSRTTTFPFVNLIFPFNINVHFEHHLNRHVPWYNLKKLSREISQLKPENPLVKAQ